ncbi:hypothetical protein U9M48_014700 [Paspalum notatum var. saurae]|uniref:Uncharacterized protein n=1 Tax=Paspalum notatum var. saurae TaxID=547442 RepID=A0AAQ3WL34_PASNO
MEKGGVGLRSGDRRERAQPSTSEDKPRCCEGRGPGARAAGGGESERGFRRGLRLTTSSMGSDQRGAVVRSAWTRRDFMAWRAAAAIMVTYGRRRARHDVTACCRVRPAILVVYLPAVATTMWRRKVRPRHAPRLALRRQPLTAESLRTGLIFVFAGSHGRECPLPVSAGILYNSLTAILA